MDKEQGDSVCHEKDGCPTDGAVLQREWRAQRAEIKRLQNELHEAWGNAIQKAISVVETYRVSVGNSAAGEIAAEWTMENLREIREELREMVPNAQGEPRS